MSEEESAGQVHAYTNGPCMFCGKIVAMTHVKMKANDGSIYGATECPNCGQLVPHNMARSHNLGDLVK